MELACPHHGSRRDCRFGRADGTPLRRAEPPSLPALAGPRVLQFRRHPARSPAWGRNVGARRGGSAVPEYELYVRRRGERRGPDVWGGKVLGVAGMALCSRYIQYGLFHCRPLARSTQASGPHARLFTTLDIIVWTRLFFSGRLRLWWEASEQPPRSPPFVFFIIYTTLCPLADC